MRMDGKMVEQEKYLKVKIREGVFLNIPKVTYFIGYRTIENTEEKLCVDRDIYISALKKMRLRMEKNRGKTKGRKLG